MAVILLTLVQSKGKAEIVVTIQGGTKIAETHHGI